MTGENALVEVRQLSQYYGGRSRQFLAVHEVDLTVHEGEFVALLGPSGCGKSTLLRIIAGLMRPTQGSVLYRGEPLQGVNPHATIVFQTFALFPWLTVQENVEVALRARGLPDNLATLRSIDLLDKVGLNGFETAYPRELSGGMRQKVGFARAMAVSPELLCLDEPFSALDVLSAESLRGELIDLWTSGGIPTKAILMVTHNIEEAVLLADRIVIMEKDPGRVVAEIAVDLRRPRQRKGSLFTDTVDRVYATMAGQTEPEHVESAPAPTGARFKLLPEVEINDLDGLLEQVVDAPRRRADLFRLADELKIDSDRLLRVTEAAELLGFARVEHGDIALTPLGETYALAPLPARKQIFAVRIRRLRLFQWLLGRLSAAEKRRIRWDELREALEEEFLPEEVERQMDIAVDWGRFAELLAYDDKREMIYLEPDGAVGR